MQGPEVTAMIISQQVKILVNAYLVRSDLEWRGHDLGICLPRLGQEVPVVRLSTRLVLVVERERDLSPSGGLELRDRKRLVVDRLDRQLDRLSCRWVRRLGSRWVRRVRCRSIGHLGCGSVGGR